MSVSSSARAQLLLQVARFMTLNESLNDAQERRRLREQEPGRIVQFSYSDARFCVQVSSDVTPSRWVPVLVRTLDRQLLQRASLEFLTNHHTYGRYFKVFESLSLRFMIDLTYVNSLLPVNYSCNILLRILKR